MKAKANKAVGRKLSLPEKLFSIVTCKDRRWKQITLFGVSIKVKNWRYDWSEEEIEEEKRITFPGLREPDLTQVYQKQDILFLSVISYSIRYQRPQQIADYYARMGHRVFYFNADFGFGERPVIKETHKNLFEVTLCFYEAQNLYTQQFDAILPKLTRQLDEVMEFFGIQDATIISEYPNWLQAIKYLKHRYAASDSIDYLDDWDGFENTATPELVKTTQDYLQSADLIIATSEYLFKKARKINDNAILVRNGTEFAHFNQIAQDIHLNKKQPVVGYYGAISHWFDADKILALAKQLPHVRVELIGQVDTDLKGADKLPNVVMLGEQPYKKLPALIKDWDVCLIPFDTTTDLIKATNPVKFYEYLSAGKKVVATEIPEIEEFKDRYVLLSNDTDEFVDHVRHCLEETDGLATKEERIQFARENDWKHRLDALNQGISAITPKISIVVLTYNNLAYTKACLNSIHRWTAYPNYEVVVVDNHSSDQTPDYLKKYAEQYDNVKLVLNEKNLGFAGGNNAGLRVATGEIFVLLNNDTIISRGWLSRILAHFRADEKCGAVGAVTNSIGNEAMVRTAYTSLKEFVDEANHRAFKQAFQSTYTQASLAMFAFAFTRKVLDSVGYLSEEYGRGMFEDDDYCMAIKSAGFKLLIAEDTLIHHFLSISFGEWKDNEEKKLLFERNKAIYEKKWNTTWQPHTQRKGMTMRINNVTASAYPELLKEAQFD